MIKILVADKLSPVGVKWLEEQDDVEVTVQPGMEKDELIKQLQQHDGMIIRSGVKATANVLAEPGRLKGIARAGVGVDNIDVPTATAKGIIVMNTPGGNTVSTAELAMTLMMALSRKVSPANASLKAGEWNRKAYQGTQLAGKTLGVIGMGRIGQTVASRAVAMEMRVIGYDPFFAGKELPGVEMVKDLNELCKRADYISLHVPKSSDTLGMIGPEQFEVMKPNCRLINAARGGIIDPKALLKALKEEKVAGAAIDVWTSEPPTDEAELELIQHPNVLAVPHLGASTEEAQEQVALEAAESLVEALRGGPARTALNAPGLAATIPESLRTYTELSWRIGAVLSSITPGALQKVEAIYRGSLAETSASALTTYLLMGLLQKHMDAPVNLVNAPVLAEERGVEIEQITSAKVKEFAHMMEVRITTDQMTRAAKGTIFGNRFPRLIEIDGYRMEIKPEGNVMIVFTTDQPGVVGKCGHLLGEAGINIADMTFCRKKEPNTALISMNLDSAPADGLLDEMRKQDFVASAHYMELPVLFNFE